MARYNKNRIYRLREDRGESSLNELLENKSYYNIYPDEEIMVISPFRILQELGLCKSEIEDRDKCVKVLNDFVKEHKKELDEARRPQSYIATFPSYNLYIERENLPNLIDAINILGRNSDKLYIPSRPIRIDGYSLAHCVCFLKKEYEDALKKGDE